MELSKCPLCGAFAELRDHMLEHEERAALSILVLLKDKIRQESRVTKRGVIDLVNSIAYDPELFRIEARTGMASGNIAAERLWAK